jgi:predicted Ser/Thr protein kinase
MLGLPRVATTQVMVGNYVIERELGRGGMGVVYAARHRVLGKPAAIKVLANPDQSNVERFFNEGRAAMAIEHEGVVRVYDIGRASDGRAYIAMELLDGSALSVLLARGPLPVRTAVGYALQIARALAAVHAVDIVHRDLKPENVIVVAGEHVKLVDFGIAKLVGELANNVKTVSGALLGTPHYMSPEQGEGVRELDARSDLYSLGCVLFAMLTGTPPFSSTGLGALIAMHMYEPVPPLASRCPSVSTALEELVERLLAKSPDDRFPTATAVAEALSDPAVLELRPTNAAATAPMPVAVPTSDEELVDRPKSQDIAARRKARSGAPPGVERSATADTVTADVVTADTVTADTAIDDANRLIAGTGRPIGDADKPIVRAAAVQRRKRSTIAIVATLLAVIGGGIAIVAVARGRDDAQPAVRDAAVALVVDATMLDAAPEIVRPVATDASVPDVVTLTIVGAPSSTEVRVRGALVGVVPRIEVPRGTQEVILVFTRDGYRSLSVPVVPDRDQKVSAKLQPRSSGAGNPDNGEPTQDILTFPR